MRSIRILIIVAYIIAGLLSSFTQRARAQESAVKPLQPPAFTPPSPTPNNTLRSPEVASDGRVAFRLYAPDASQVMLHAEGLEADPNTTPQEMMKNSAGTPMKRGTNGVWTVEFGPIQPGVYRYTFSVDGVQTTDPRNPTSSESLSSVRSMYEVPGATQIAYRADIPHGAIASVFYPSIALNGMRRMHIYTPPGYGVENHRYPVLYLLHGGGDTDDSWPTVGRAGAILDNLIAEHKAMPMILVMPMGHISRDFQLRTGQNTMGHDAFNQDLVGSIIPYVAKNYLTIEDRAHRALAGLSMGGLQTLTISLTSSSLFSYIGVFSSGWFPQMLDQVEKTDLADYKANGQPFKLYWVGAGKYDIAKSNSEASVKLLKLYGIHPVSHASGGFHAWNSWRDYLVLFAPQLFR